MKTVIVEDEFIAAQSLQRLLKATGYEIDVLTILQSVEESVEWFSQYPDPDLVFMDIHLADGYSFSIFEQVKIECPIVFTTAYDEYALKAFEVNSIDYLLKPINKKKLEKALSKLQAFSAKDKNAGLIAQLLDSLKPEKAAYKSNFLIPHKDKLIPLPVEKIAFIHSEYKMAKLVASDKQTYTLDVSLDDLSKQLNPSAFFRANRQFIVSRRAISDISVWFGGRLSINLFQPVPDKILVSRARVPEFKDWYTSEQN